MPELFFPVVSTSGRSQSDCYSFSLNYSHLVQNHRRDLESVEENVSSRLARSFLCDTSFSLFLTTHLAALVAVLLDLHHRHLIRPSLKITFMWVNTPTAPLSTSRHACFVKYANSAASFCGSGLVFFVYFRSCFVYCHDTFNKVMTF